MLTKMVENYTGLSAEIGDNLSSGWIDNAQQSVNLIKYWSILLAEYIKTAHKKADLFPSRFFRFCVPIFYSITFWNITLFKNMFRISSIMLNELCSITTQFVAKALISIWFLLCIQLIYYQKISLYQSIMK